MINIAKKSVGLGEPVYIVAEMSGNHCGRIEYAKQIIDAAVSAGADAVKLQTYRPDTITLNSDKEDFLIPGDNPWCSSNNLYALYEQAFTPWEWHRELFDYAHQQGITLFSAPFDETAVDLLESLHCPAYKIASPEITHIPLIKKVARTGKPVIISTGVAEKEDIDLAIRTVRDCHNEQLILLKCTSAYPTPPSEIHLSMIPEFRAQFACEAGLSDHSLGIAVPAASVALGCRFIEKHLVLSREDSSVDGFFSLTPEEFSAMVQAVRTIEQAMGRVSFETSAEVRKNAWGKRSLYVSCSVKKGDAINAENIRCVRPGYGLHPKYYEQVLGKTFKQDAHCGDRLTLDLIDGLID